MDPIDSSDREAIGWHLIARGGDMTARVHPAMQLGVLPSGDLSFEAPDAVVQLDLAGEALTLAVVDEGYELELEAGERIQTLRVGAQTHVCLDFLGHTLDIDNDFAVASPPGDALALYVVRKGEPRQALGPLSAPARGGEILVGERSSVTPLKAVPIDYLQREHAAAAAAKRQAAAGGAGVRRVFLALAASILVVAGLVVTALYVASRSVEDAMLAETGAETAEATTDPAAVAAGSPTADAQTAGAAQPATMAQAIPAAEGVSQDMLARLSALLQAEPLPDKATIDFAVESLRSLMVAYPDDPRIPAALVSLNERLVEEARQSYDEGDAFRAGRLIEQATSLGLAAASVAETLDYFAEQPPGMLAATENAAAAEPREPEPVVTEAEAEAMLAEALAQEEARGGAPPVQAQAPRAEEQQAQGQAQAQQAETETEEDPAGLDSLVESATGLALGALAVEVIIEDVEPDQSETDPVLAALGPVLPLTSEAEGVDSRVALALDSYLEESAATAESSVSANELPVGFAADQSGTGTGQAAPERLLSSAELQSAPSGPRFRPYSQLDPLRQAPLAYPSRALEGAEGSIDVEFTITEQGRVIDVNVRGDAPAIFLREAVRTIRTWRFQPVLESGEAVPVRTALRVTYRS